MNAATAEAESVIEALALDPNNAAAQFNWMPLPLRNDFEEGFRFMKAVSDPLHGLPRRMLGSMIIHLGEARRFPERASLYGEQGIGDSIMMMRYCRCSQTWSQVGDGICEPC